MKSLINILRIRIFDIFIIALLLLLCVLWFSIGFIGGDSLTATVYLDGKEVFSASLNEFETPEEKEFSGVTLLFESDGVTFAKSDCANRLCVKAGKLSRAGDAMACIPNKVVVELKGEKKDADIVTY